MRKVTFIGLIMVLVLIGCGDTAYHNAIEKGLDYIASEEYKKAESAFELALDEKKEDVKGTTLLKQTKDYQEAEVALSEAEIDEAVKMAEKVSQVKNGSNALVKKADGILSTITEFQVKLDTLNESYSTAMEQFDIEDYDGAKVIIDNLLSEDLSHFIFQSIKINIEELEEDIESALVVKEVADAEEASRIKREEMDQVALKAVEKAAIKEDEVIPELIEIIETVEPEPEEEVENNRVNEIIQEMEQIDHEISLLEMTASGEARGSQEYRDLLMQIVELLESKGSLVEEQKVLMGFS